MDMLAINRKSESSRIIIPIEIRKALALKGRDIRISLEMLNRNVEHGEPCDSGKSCNKIKERKHSSFENNKEGIDVYKRDIGCILCSETEGLVEIKGYKICSKCNSELFWGER